METKQAIKIKISNHQRTLGDLAYDEHRKEPVSSLPFSHYVILPEALNNVSESE